MSYYRGDGGNYYRGDYYRGDPFLGGLVAGVVGKGLKKAAGWVGARIGRAAASAPVRTAMESLPAVGVGMGLAESARRFGVGSSIPMLPPMAGGGYTGEKWPTNRDGTPRRARKDGKPYKRATLNPLNPRALRRALRRTEGFEHFAKRAVNSLYKVIDGRRVRTFKKKTPAN